jgi:hypothetical protein
VFVTTHKLSRMDGSFDLWFSDYARRRGWIIRRGRREGLCSVAVAYQVVLISSLLAWWWQRQYRVAVRIREDGFFRRIMPPLPASNDDLDRPVDTDKPVAANIPFATLPQNQYIRGPRYRVTFDRVVTPTYSKDIDELKDWDFDIRKVLGSVMWWEWLLPWRVVDCVRRKAGK